MAAVFNLDPAATIAGLGNAGQARGGALASGLPALPIDQYIGGYSSLVTALVGTEMALLGGKVGASTILGVTSVNSYESQEAINAADLAV